MSENDSTTGQKMQKEVKKNNSITAEKLTQMSETDVISAGKNM